MSAAKPFWNILSLAIPGAVATLDAALVLASCSGLGDMADRLGSGISFILGLRVASPSREAAVFASPLRGEQDAWLAVPGLLANAAIALAIAITLMSD